MDEPQSVFRLPRTRAMYALAVVTAITGVLMVVDMIFKLNIGGAIFSWKAFAILYPIAYLITPILQKRLPLVRW